MKAAWPVLVIVGAVLALSRKATGASKAPDASKPADTVPKPPGGKPAPEASAQAPEPDATVKPNVQPKGVPSDLHDYIDFLAKLQGSATMVSTNDVWNVAEYAADMWGVPVDWVWAVLSHEGGANSLTGLHGGSVEAAKAKNSSAWGMGQITRSRFLKELPMLEALAAQGIGDASMLPLHHPNLIDVVPTAQYVAASLRRMLEKWGQPDTYQDIGDWWAGGKGNAKSDWTAVESYWV